MKKVLSNNKGFSLIELIVVIAILGVLVGVAAPQLIGYVDRTREATDISNLENVKRAAEIYIAEKDGVIDNASLTKDVADDKFGGELPELKSRANSATPYIKIEYKDDAVVVSPNATDLTTGN